MQERVESVAVTVSHAGLGTVTIGLICFQSGCYTKLALVYVFILCYNIFWVVVIVVPLGRVQPTLDSYAKAFL